MRSVFCSIGSWYRLLQWAFFWNITAYYLKPFVCDYREPCLSLSWDSPGEVPELIQGCHRKGEKERPFFCANFAHKRGLLWLPFINTFVYLVCAKCRIECHICLSVWHFHWARTSAALIISHFEAVIHFASHLVIFEVLSFSCWGTLCLRAALIIFCTNRFRKQRRGTEDFFRTLVCVNIKWGKKHYYI